MRHERAHDREKTFSVSSCSRSYRSPILAPNVLPWNRGWPRTEEPINRLNELIAALAAEEGVPLLDFYAALESPDEHGRMRDEWTDDGDHPSIEGYRRLGELAFRLP